MKDKIFILGVGHNTPVYIDLCEICGYEIVGLYHYDDTRTGEVDHEYPILGSFGDLFLEEDLSGKNFALSQGNNKIREELFFEIKRRGGKIPSIIHPTAVVSRFAKIGEGSVIHAFCMVHPDTSIGDNTVLSFRASVSHTSSVGAHCYMAVGSSILAYTEVADYVLIGVNAWTISAKVPYIGEYSIIGAGALLTKAVEPYSVMAGVPAIKIRSVN